MKYGKWIQIAVIFPIILASEWTLAKDDPKDDPNALEVKSFQFASEGGGVTGGGYFWIKYGSLVPAQMVLEKILENKPFDYDEDSAVNDLEYGIFLGVTKKPASFLINRDSEVYANQLRTTVTYVLGEDHRYTWDLKTTGYYKDVPRELASDPLKFTFQDVRGRKFQGPFLPEVLDSQIWGVEKIPEPEDQLAVQWREIIQDAMNQIKDSDFMALEPIGAYKELMDTYSSWAGLVWQEQARRLCERVKLPIKECEPANPFLSNLSSEMQSSVDVDAKYFIEKMARIRPAPQPVPWYSNEAPLIPPCNRELYFEVFSELQSWVKGGYDHRRAVEGIFGRGFLSSGMDRTRNDVLGKFHHEYIMTCEIRSTNSLIPEKSER